MKRAVQLLVALSITASAVACAVLILGVLGFNREVLRQTTVSMHLPLFFPALVLFLLPMTQICRSKLRRRPALCIVAGAFGGLVAGVAAWVTGAFATEYGVGTLVNNWQYYGGAATAGVALLVAVKTSTWIYGLVAVAVALVLEKVFRRFVAHEVEVGGDWSNREDSTKWRRPGER